MAKSFKAPKDAKRPIDEKSNQAAFASYSQAKVSDDPDVDEVLETDPPAGPVTLQERGVASKSKKRGAGEAASSK